MDSILSQLEKDSNDPSHGDKGFRIFMSNLSSRDKRRMARHHMWIWGRGIAAVISVPLFCALMWTLFTRKPNSRWEEICVPYGEIQSLRLSDSTSLLLNAGTRVTYPTRFSGQSREIFVDGEVLAEVTKNKKRPFIIHAGTIDITVLGTKFNLKAYKESETVDLYLTEGSVRFGHPDESDGQSIIVKPGYAARFIKQSNSFETMPFDIQRYRTFNEDHTLLFHKKTLRSIASELERIFGIRIVITNEQLARMHILAFFSNGESPEEILSSLNIDNQMTITNDDGVFYLSPR